MPRDSNWISVKDVAAILELDPATVWRMSGDGRLDSIRTYRPSKTTYYWRPDVEDYKGRAMKGPDDTRERNP